MVIVPVKKKNASDELKFEEALKRLEQIVEEMEAGEVSLDDLLKKYEEGVSLSQFCQSKLKEAQQRIEVLVKGKGGSPAKLKPFDKEFEEGEVEDESEERGSEKVTKGESLF